MRQSGTPLRSCIFLDEWTKPRQEKLHPCSCHKETLGKTTYQQRVLKLKITAPNRIDYFLRTHTTICSRVWPQRNKGWNMVLAV